MVARDFATGRVTEPVPRKKNPNYNKDDGSPMYLPDEPHIGIHVNADPPPRVEQTGSVRGGTTNPPEGEDGSVQRLDNDGKPAKGEAVKDTKS